MRKSLLIATFLVTPFIRFQALAQVRYEVVNPEIVQSRLALYKGNDRERETALFKIFVAAGCPVANLSEQPVPKRKEPNVICVLPGDTAEEIIIGAHFDHVFQGRGVADNWSGASLLPSLLQSLLGSKHKHTFIFIGFTGEESGDIGSDFYVKSLSNRELSEIKLMITIDSIGLGPTKVWVRRSDQHAVELLNGTARAMKLPLEGVNVDGFGDSDEEPFVRKGVKTITIHSITNENKQILHSGFDDPSAISFHDYYDTYRLLAAYLAILDKQVGTEPAASAQGH